MVTPNTMALLKQHLAITGGQVRLCPPGEQFPVVVALCAMLWLGGWFGWGTRGSMGTWPAPIWLGELSGIMEE